MSSRGQPAEKRKRSWWRVHFGSLRFYILLVITAVVLHLIGSVVESISDVQPNSSLADEFRKKQLDIWAEMNKLLIALSTVVIGGIGGFVLKHEHSSVTEVRQMRRAAA